MTSKKEKKDTLFLEPTVEMIVFPMPSMMPNTNTSRQRKRIMSNVWLDKMLYQQ